MRLPQIVLTLCLTAAPLPAQPLRIEVRTSLPECVLYLMECLEHNPHQSTLLPAAFTALHPPAEQEAALIEYRKLNSEQVDRDVLERMAVESQDGEEFLQRTRTYLDASLQDRLRQALAYFEPAYRDSLWLSSLTRLQEQKTEIEEALESSQMIPELEKVRTLLDSRWSPQDPFEIALIPIPARGAKGVVSFAHSIGYLQVLEMLEGDQVNHRLGVLFHEIVHSLWHSQNPETRRRLRSAFSGLEGRLAWQELNEGLATALGNGLFQSKLDHKLPNHPWYADSTIDSYAAELEPIVESRIQQQRPLDEDFAREAQTAFIRCFPQAASDTRLLFRHVTSSQNGLQDWLTRQTRVSSWSDAKGSVETALLLEFSSQHPLAERGALCQRLGDYWKVTVVGPDPEAWKAILKQLLARPQMSEGWLRP
ncbi:hypothetical protein JST97_09570 [bacterium]|nr:hypothetical protein [bacterium]